MTSKSPRIYTYKITFEGVPYYYYGVKKENCYDQEYWGSPHTNKWCWELYTPKKQILEIFDYTDEGWLEANEVEKRLIKPFLNDDWCLNECVGGIMSLKIRRQVGRKLCEDKKGVHGLSKQERIQNASKAGKIGGRKTYERGIGLFSISKEELKERSKRIYEEGKGLASISKEKRVEYSKMFGKKGGSISGKKHKENKTGFFAMTDEQRRESCRKAGTKTKEKGVGIFSIPYEEMRERNLRNSLQKWKCLETGHISNAGALTVYQRKRGIDTSRRIRLE